MPELVNIANTLTVGRILCVPVVVMALVVATSHGSVAAASVFAAVAVTDGLDGRVARARQSVTKFGRVMDPVADKLLIAATLISLVSLNRLAGWVALAIIAREFAVSALRIAASTRGLSTSPSLLGKLKTVLQVVAVTVVIAAQNPSALWVEFLVYLALAVTLVSGADYALKFRRGLRAERTVAAG